MARVALAACLGLSTVAALAGCAAPSPDRSAVTTPQPTPRARASYLPTATLSPANDAPRQPAPVVVTANANLRAGPGADYDRVGSAAPGDTVELTARNAAGDWYQLASGAWIAAFLVDGAPAGLPIAGDAASPAAVAEATTTPAPPAGSIPPGAAYARLLKVVDGATVEVLLAGNQETVRYIGIATPEQGQPGYRAAADANTALLGAGDLYLVADASDRDPAGRLLRYVYTPDGALVNRAMVAQGWAQPAEVPPDTAHMAELRQAAVEAAGAGLGFWSGWSPDGAPSYALAAGNVNMRAGPGAEFEITTTAPDNTPLAVLGRSADGEWLQVRAPDRSSGWVAAGLVVLRAAIDEVAVAGDAPAGTEEAATPERAQAAPAQGGALPPRVAALNPAGGDEMVVIQNPGPAAVDLSGWSIQSYDGSVCRPAAEQVFWFPAGSVLGPGAAVRVHSGPDALDAPPGDLLWTQDLVWDDAGDRVELRDARGGTVSSGAYGGCR